MPLGSDIAPSPSADPQSLGDLADNFEVSEEELLQEALRLFGYS